MNFVQNYKWNVKLMLSLQSIMSEQNNLMR